jgi:predicted transcriptional regulator of viral defense system
VIKKAVGFVGSAGHPVLMTSELYGDLRELARSQAGVLSRGQALSGGLTRTIIRFRLEQGRWQRLQTGVYAVFSGPPGRQTILWGAVLRAGPGAMLSYQTAAEVSSLSDQPSPLISITVPGDRYVERIPGVILHRSRRASQARHPVLAPPRTRVEETVLDLAGMAATLDDACGWITRAVGRRLTTQAQLQAAMELRARLRWRRQLTEALTTEWSGVHSSLEYRYLRNVERPHALPRGTRQAPARRGGGVIYRDVLYEQYATAVELDGRAAHPGDQRWPDIQRDNAAAADGIMTLRYGWFDVTERPCEVAAQVARVLARRGYTRARGCSPACPVTRMIPVLRGLAVAS